MLVVVGVIVAITIPGGKAVRDRGRDARSASDLRQHVAAMQSYAGDWDEAWPFLTDPGVNQTRIEAEGVAVDVRFFDIYLSWPIGLAGEGYTPLGSGSLFSPWSSGGSVWETTYYYSSTCITDPDYWRYGLREEGRAQWNAQRVYGVAMPERKGVLIDEAGRQARRSLIGRADGGAGRVDEGSLTEPYREGDRAPDETHETSGGSVRGLVVRHTVDGLDGQDVRATR